MGNLANSPAGRVMCIWIPVWTFVGLGMEHSVANVIYNIQRENKIFETTNFVCGGGGGGGGGGIFFFPKKKKKKKKMFLIPLAMMTGKKK